MGCLTGRASPPPPTAPDNSGLIDAMNAQAAASLEAQMKFYDLGVQQLDWAKKMGQWQMDTTEKVLAVQLPMMKNQAKWALEDRTRWEENFKPIEDELIREAKAFDSPGRREEEAARATADVGRAFDAVRESSIRELSSYGIDPTQVRAQALDRKVQIAEAATKAGASTQAKRYVEEKGRALKGQVVAMGSGLPMQAVNTGVAASNIGSQGVSGANQTVNAQANARGVGVGYLNAGTSAGQVGVNALTAAGGLINSGYRNQLAGWTAQNNLNQQKSNDFMGALGTIGGLGIAGYAAGMFAEGGEAGKVAIAQGIAGEVNGPGGPKDDAIPAMLSDEEYVIPAEVVHYKGTEHFDKLINKTNEALGIPPEDKTMQNGVPVQGVEQ